MIRLTLLAALALSTCSPPPKVIAPAPIPYAQARLSGLKVIREKCLRCHNGANAPNGLRMDTVDNMVRGGKRGPAVIPYKPHKSLIWQAVTANGDVPIMPPFDRLADDEIEALRIWIDHGCQSMSMGGQEP